MTIAARMNHHMRERGIKRGAGAIYALAVDPHNVHCLTESDLDTWWTSLPPEEKAEIYEERLGPSVESCKYCGCTQARACVTNGLACSWLNAQHTVCSAPACAQAHVSAMLGEIFHGGPQKVAVPSLRRIDEALRTVDWLGIGDDVATKEVDIAAL